MNTRIDHKSKLKKVPHRHPLKNVRDSLLSMFISLHSLDTTIIFYKFEDYMKLGKKKGPVICVAAETPD